MHQLRLMSDMIDVSTFTVAERPRAKFFQRCEANVIGMRHEGDYSCETVTNGAKILEIIGVLRVTSLYTFMRSHVAKWPHCCNL